jgi:2,5-dihydroxypyridine 5,6-dioxygenase
MVAPDARRNYAVVVMDCIEHRWIEAFCDVVRRCAAAPGEPVCILAESRSRAINLDLAELAAHRLGCRPFRVTVPTPPAHTMPIRSTGASRALQGHPGALAALKASPLILDLTREGLLHAPELNEILAAGSRVLMISDEHPEILERLQPRDEDQPAAKAALKALRAARVMHVSSAAGTDLRVDVAGAPSAAVWGWTDRPGTIAHWPGGVVVAFPKTGAVNGALALAPGDANLTFKRFVETPVRLTIRDDHVTAIEGDGADAVLMREHLAAWNDSGAYAVSHVGWGLNPRARREALLFHDKAELNGTELRAAAGNFLFSTGANEFAGRYTEGHFDIPVFGCTIALDGVVVVKEGRLA